MQRRLQHFAALVCLIGLIGCGGLDELEDDDDSKAKRGGDLIDHSTPQTLAESLKSAAAREDMKSMFLCFTPDGREQMLRALVLGFRRIVNAADQLKKSDPKVEKIKAVLTKHNVDMSGSDPLKTVPDTTALFADIATVTKQIAAEDPSARDNFQRMRNEAVNSEFSNFQVAGDDATADVTTTVNGKTRESRFGFTRIDGKWYVDIAKARKLDLERRREQSKRNLRDIGKAIRRP